MSSSIPTDEAGWMRAAVEAARTGIAAGQTPFGAALVHDGQLIVATHNRVWQNTDITAHAEIDCLRQACRELGTIDLAGCTIYSTTEPCPMCFSAIHWARIDRIVFGTSIETAKEHGFRELPISNRQMKEISGSEVLVEGQFLLEECRELFTRWASQPRRRTY